MGNIDDRLQAATHVLNKNQRAMKLS